MTTAAKKPDLTKLYQQRTPPLDLSSQEFRAHLIRNDVPKADRVIPVDGVIASLEWYYEPGNPVLLGSLEIHKPDMGGGLKIHDGHVLRLQVRWGGVWRELWRMRLREGDLPLEGATTFELADDGIILQESTDSWHFTKSAKKGKPKGWLTHEIVREVARRYRIPLGKVAQGRHYITDLSGEMSPMAVIQKAYAIEKRATRRRFTIQWRNGKLNVLPLRRNPLLYTLGPQIENAAIGREDRDEKFATAVTVRATVKKKGSRSRRKIKSRYVNEKAVARDGFVHRLLDGGDVKDEADAIRKAKRHIAKHSVRKRTLTGVEHRGIAFLRRGDAIHVSIPEQGFTGKQAICFVSAGRWRLSGGNFTMSLDLTFDDPYYVPKQKRKAKDKKTRATKRKKKK